MSVPMPTQAMATRPQLPWSERAYQKTLSAALAALGFFLLFSTAGVYVSMGVLLALCLAAPARIWRTRFWREPVLGVGLVLLAYIALRTFIGEGWNMPSVHLVNKYQELLMIPLLWALLRNARRPQSFANGLMAGSLLVAVLYWAGYLLSLDRGTGFGFWLHTRRISAGFGLAVCAFMLFEHARLGRLPRAAGHGAALFLVATVLFAIDGRTGYGILLVLLCCAAFRAAPRAARIWVTVAALALTVLVGAVSHSVRDRVLETVSGVESAVKQQGGPVSSTTARFEVWHSAVLVARENWLLGTGWGGYARAVDEVSRRRYADPAQVIGARSQNPHSEYLMQLSAGGLPALLLFTLWIALPVGRAVRDAGSGRPWSSAVGCVALAFGVAALFNSLLLDFVEAHFYAALLAWLLVRRVED